MKSVNLYKGRFIRDYPYRERAKFFEKTNISDPLIPRGNGMGVRNVCFSKNSAYGLHGR